jgi:hypothetical protein
LRIVNLSASTNATRRKPATLVQRAAATEKTMLRYRYRAFDWATGATCLHLARAQMKNMGHRPPAIPRFTTALGAKRALDATGFADLAGLFDSMFERIAHASMLVGDLAILPGEELFDAVIVSAGNGLFLGWHGSDLSQLHNVKDPMGEISGAWRL